MTRTSTDTETRTLLVIGATGGIGSEIAKSFAKSGWHVRALARNPRKARKQFAHLGVSEWVKGDALSAKDVRNAAEGATAIFHGANPPGYKKWREHAIPMLAHSIKAAKINDARLLFPGNIYNFGPDAWPRLNEQSPQNPLSKKGAIRVEMEAMIHDSGIRSLIVRAGDFFGPHAPGSWLPNGMITPGKPLRSVTYPGIHDKGHAWAYLPDLAETFRQLMDVKDRLGTHETFHFRGHYFERGVDFAKTVAQVAGLDDSKIKPLPWWALRLASPFMTTFREILEMRYLWQHTVELENDRLTRFLGQEPHTDLEHALHVSLDAHKCLRADIHSAQEMQTA